MFSSISLTNKWDTKGVCSLRNAFSLSVLIYSVGIVFNFCIFLLNLLLFQVFVLRDYAKETLSLRWRSWMTSSYLDRYLKNQNFYKIQSQSIIDNPDQRIVDDLSSFTGTALAFSLTLFSAAVDLISFSNILYGIYPPLFAVLLAYSLGGTAISIFLGRVIFSFFFSAM